MDNMQKNDIKTQIAEAFNNYETNLNGEKSSIAHALRKKSFDDFLVTGFPTQKQEDWRYTNLNFLFKERFDLTKTPSTEEIDSIGTESLDLFIEESNVLTFINGVFSEKHSKIVSKAKSIFIGKISDAWKRFPDTLAEYYSKGIGINRNSFADVNTALSNDGACVIIPEGKTLNESINILNINDSRSESSFTNPRILIIVGECSQARILETSITMGDKPAFTNVVTEIFANTFSKIGYYKIQNNGDRTYYIGNSYIHQERASILNTATVTFSGRFVRNNLNVLVADQLCESNLYGLYLISGSDFVDNHTFIDHAKPNSQSVEIYKGILDESATAVFNGRILVRQDAQKTNAYQTNRNILLTDTASIYTKPQLEIYADDVKCSHGATCGNLDQDALFYLETRGISKSKAKSLLLNSFAIEVVEKIEIDEIRDEVKKIIANMLKIEDIYFCDVLDQK